FQGVDCDVDHAFSVSRKICRHYLAKAEVSPPTRGGDMRRRVFFGSFAIALLFAGSISAQTLGAVLTSSQEVPPCAASGFGNATVTFDSARQNVNVTITVSNLGSPISIFHIHEGPAGVAGNVVLNLIGLGGVFMNGTMTGTFPIASDVAKRMLQNPSNFYV